MEWGRAKTILIIAFLVLNVMLSYQLWTDNNLFWQSNVETEFKESVMQSLKENNITLSQEIPTHTPEVGEITIQTPIEEVGTFDFSPPDTVEQLEVQWKQVLAFGDQYEWDDFNSADGVYVYNQQYNGFSMFEMNVVVDTQQSQAITYRQIYAAVNSNDNDNRQEVLSAFQALKLLIDNYLQIGANITSVELGYHGKIFDLETQVLAPKWRFTLADGTTYYVHAINGEVEELKKGSMQ
ncbi:two-component system regulatory protein YycI [Longirhabdus pacifica]|uniref:two-component system regulatory protein YycI n=1 Tax=Longirhabdus pacifica TaxID=2305227 RepID=UPI001008AD8A|nr:two-component system regulatory protein YycI [Longirhabdus pacifica]